MNSTMRPSAAVCYLCATVALITAAVDAKPALAQVTPQELIDWGVEVFEETTETLQRSGTALFAETASLNGNQYGGSGGFAYVWPLSTQFRVQNSLVRIDPESYAPALRKFSDEARTRYWKSAGGGYRSGVASGATRFYDDNAHIAVALMEAYRITADPIYLTRAEETYDFAISGEDALGGGGIYFHEFDHSTKETISTLQGARAALMLYQATEEPNYLADATRLYDWARNYTQQPDGLFLEKYYLTGSKADSAGDFALVNAAGDAISVNLEFYAATGDSARLQEAQRIANRSLTRYFNRTTGAINDEGFWAFELVDALNDLNRIDGNAVRQESVVDALEWLHSNRRDPNGHYGRLWGRVGFQATALSEWHLNDQASVARSYLHTGLSMLAEAPIAGDYNDNGIVDAADYVAWRNGGPLQNDPTPGVQPADYEFWRARFGNAAGGRSSNISRVPEPLSFVLLFIAMLFVLADYRPRYYRLYRYRRSVHMPSFSGIPTLYASTPSSLQASS